MSQYFKASGHDAESLPGMYQVLVAVLVSTQSRPDDDPIEVAHDLVEFGLFDCADVMDHLIITPPERAFPDAP